MSADLGETFFVGVCTLKDNPRLPERNIPKGSVSLKEKPSYYRSFARIDLDAIESNFNELCGLLEPDVKKMCVIKADAYGHGAHRVALFLQDKCDYFAVASINEGEELRAAGVKTPLLILSYVSPLEYEDLLKNDITATVYDLESADLLSKTAVSLGKTAKVHVAVDTGMGRIGFPDNEDGADAVLQIEKLPGLFVEGLFSHYACSDEKDRTSANEQTARFENFIALLEKRGISIPIKHICNSAAVIEKEKNFDMVRFGVSLYGLYPSQEVHKERVHLIPAMRVESHIVFVKTVEKGTKIGYGQIYTAPCEKKIATVCIGYADGFNRCFTNKGYVLIKGQKAPVVGKVCMDQIMVDVSSIPSVKIGDRAVILGKDGEAAISAEELGSLCDSFSYEVLCNFMPRIKRIYFRHGEKEND